ncbi:AMIN-like domain-containing (lipo)protein [Phycicoccus flavus]|uniref:AMIN-like domain-containing (lipo)protein n=1 Tax=Phycicoccus flavus TaxID=2502783 RepID=UPI000FEBD337|nr:hypothetical protein [Phycicoccus flavus]NHA69381.1 hypothetical protein [Phycicoccus flavus]
MPDAPTSPRATPRRRAVPGRPAVVVAVAVALAAGACSSGDEQPSAGTSAASPTSAPGSAAPTTSAPETSPSPSEPAPATTSASPSPSGSVTPSTTDSAPAEDGFGLQEQRSPAWPRLGPSVGIGVASRVGRHAGYDRVVYEFTGTGTPTYRVRYVDEPKDDVSGDPVDVPGDSYLSVGLTTVETPGGDDAPPRDPSPRSLEGTVVTYAPAIWGGFEGRGDGFIGLRGERRPFRVTTLSDPTRLVVDIAK